MKKILLLLSFLVYSINAQTYYRSAFSGNWNDQSIWEITTDGGTNWMPNPGSYPTGVNNTQTTIRNGHTINLNGDYSVDQVTIDVGGTLNVSATSTLANGTGDDITVNGTLKFSAQLSGSSNPTIQVNSGGVINFQSGNTYLSGLTINNNGTLNLLDGWNIVFNGSLVINNLSGGLFNSNSSTGTDNVMWVQGSGNQLNNTGIFRKEGTGTTTIQIPFNNDGNVNILNGDIAVSSNSASTCSGTFTLTSGTSIGFAGATFTMNEGVKFTGTGNVNIGSTVNSVGTTNGLMFDSNIILGLTGILGGDGITTIKGTLNWSQGQLADSGTKNFISGSTINLTGFANKYITNGTVNNAGTLNFSEGQLAFSNSAAFTNTGTMNVSGALNLANASGIYSNKFVNEGTLNIDPGSGNTFTSGVKFENKGTTTIASGTFSITYGGLYLTSGTLDNSAGTLTLASGLNIYRTTGTISNSFTFPANINVEYLGSAQVTTGNELPTTETVLQNLTINNSGGVILNSNVKVNSALYLTSGNLFLGDNNLTIVGSIVGTISTGNMIITNGSGSFMRCYTVGSSGYYTYPIGDNTGTVEYTPAVFQFTSSPAGTVGIRVTNSKHGNNGSASNYLKRYWTITASGVSSPQYNVTFYYTDDDVVGTESNLYGGKFDGSTWTTLTAVNTETNSFSSGTQTTFSDFTAGELGGLPVELTSFTALLTDNKVTLNWQTATEVNNYGFNVERSEQVMYKSNEWEKIGFVKGNGNSNSPKSYSFSDPKLSSGRVKYRLKQIDLDGQYEYSNAVEVNVDAPTSFSVYQNFPNPFNPSTKIKYELPQNSFVTIKVFDAIGREIKSLLNQQKETGFHEINFDGKDLPSGVYIYKIQAGEFIQTRKMILMK
jgi:hypothetical protein